MAKQRGSWQFHVTCDSSDSVQNIMAEYTVQESTDINLSSGNARSYTLSGADVTSLRNVISALSAKIDEDEDL